MANNVDNQSHSNTPDRLTQALAYCAIRSLELDLGMKLNTLIVNHFQKNASKTLDFFPPDGGV